MTRYIKLWLSFARNSFLRQSEFKTDFLGRLAVEAVWLSTYIVLYKSVFQLVPNLRDWSPADMWFFTGTLFIVDGFTMIFFQENQNRFGQLIRNGLLDFYMLYPASTAFLSMMRFINVIAVVNLFTGTLLILWLSATGLVVISFASFLLWFFYLICGVITVGSFGILVCSLAFWTTQTSNLMWLFYEVYRLGHRPENLYAPWLRRITLSLFPAAFFISVPVQLALGKLGGFWHLTPPLVAALSLFVSLAVWRRGLRRYEGAMS